MDLQEQKQINSAWVLIKTSTTHVAPIDLKDTPLRTRSNSKKATQYHIILWLGSSRRVHV